MLIMFGLGCFGVAKAQITQLINFAGKVTNIDGTELLDGNYDFEFELYDVATGGTALWSETLSSSTRFRATITAATSTADGYVYTYGTESATTTLRIGQYLSLTGTGTVALITDYNLASSTISVASAFLDYGSKH